MRRITIPKFFKNIMKFGNRQGNSQPLTTPKTQRLTSLLRFIFLTTFSAFILTSIFIAFPKTEEVAASLPFNLNVKDDDYWKKSYILELQIKEADKEEAEKKVRETKSIIHRRLSNFGVEEVRINDYTPEEIEVDQPSSEANKEADEEPQDEKIVKRYVQVTVQTTLDQTAVESLIRNRTYIRLMIPKEDIDTNDQFAQLLPENYTPTQFTRHDFRNILIKELPTTTGESAFFAVYKASPLSSKKFNSFLREQAGRTIGIAVDGLVYPYDIPFDFGRDSTVSNTTQTTAIKPDFAPGVAQTADQAETIDLLYNSGVIPVVYTVLEQEELEVELLEVNFEQVLLSISAGLVAMVIYLLIRYKQRRETVLRYLFTTVVTFSVWISLLKFFDVPVDLFMLLLIGVLLVPIIKIVTFRGRNQYTVEIGLLISLIGVVFLTDGYVNVAAVMLLKLTLGILILVPLGNFYISNMKKMLLR